MLEEQTIDVIVDISNDVTEVQRGRFLDQLIFVSMKEHNKEEEACMCYDLDAAKQLVQAINNRINEIEKDNAEKERNQQKELEEANNRAESGTSVKFYEDDKGLRWLIVSFSNGLKKVPMDLCQRPYCFFEDDGSVAEIEERYNEVPEGFDGIDVYSWNGSLGCPCGSAVIVVVDDDMMLYASQHEGLLNSDHHWESIEAMQEHYTLIHGSPVDISCPVCGDIH